MSPRNDQQFIQAHIITSFLQGERVGLVTKVSKVTSAESCVVLQRRFRHVPHLERAIRLKEQEMTACTQKLGGAEVEIDDLRAPRRVKQRMQLLVV
jgi:UDP-N-acetylglucosamine enolpyruvyl transferase